MPNIPDNQDYNTVYKLSLDAQNQQYTLTVEYYSDENNIQIHRKKHKLILDEAKKWLEGLGKINPEQCKIKVIPRVKIAKTTTANKNVDKSKKIKKTKLPGFDHEQILDQE